LEDRKTTIQVTLRTRLELIRLKGELLRKDGVERTFDDLIQELLYFLGQRRAKKGLCTLELSQACVGY
jgi:hypothetical protein